jgi:hypothetical protein
MNEREFYFLIFWETLLSLIIFLGLTKLVILILSLCVVYTTIKVGSRGFSVSWLDFRKFVREFLRMKDE